MRLLNVSSRRVSGEKSWDMEWEGSLFVVKKENLKAEV